MINIFLIQNLYNNYIKKLQLILKLKIEIFLLYYYLIIIK